MYINTEISICARKEYSQFTVLVYFPALLQISQFIRISNFFGLSITEETSFVEMRVWCIKLVLQCKVPNDSLFEYVIY
jgi:hypothetical protein